MEIYIFSLIIFWGTFLGYSHWLPKKDLLNHFSPNSQNHTTNPNSNYIQDILHLLGLVLFSYAGSVLIKFTLNHFQFHNQFKIILFYSIALIFYLIPKKNSLKGINQGIFLLLLGLITIFSCTNQHFLNTNSAFWILLGLMGLIILYSKDKLTVLVPTIGIFLSILPIDIALIYLSIIVLNKNIYLNSFKKYILAILVVLFCLKSLINWQQDGWLIALMCWLALWHQFKNIPQWHAILIGVVSLAMIDTPLNFLYQNEILILLISLTLLWVSKKYEDVALLAVLMNTGFLFCEQIYIFYPWLVLIFAMFTKYRKNNYHSILLSAALMAVFYFKNKYAIDYFYFLIPIIATLFLYIKNKNNTNIYAIYIMLLTVFFSFLIGHFDYLWLFLFPIILFLLKEYFKEYFWPVFLFWSVLFLGKIIIIFGWSLLILEHPVPHFIWLLIPIVFLQRTNNKYVESLLYFIEIIFLVSGLIWLNLDKNIVQVMLGYILLLVGYLGVKKQYELVYILLTFAVFKLIFLMMQPWLFNVYVGIPIFNYLALLYLTPMFFYKKFNNFKSVEYLMFLLMFIWMSANIRLYFHDGYINIDFGLMHMEAFTYCITWSLFLIFVSKHRKLHNNLEIK